MKKEHDESMIYLGHNRDDLYQWKDSNNYTIIGGMAIDHSKLVVGKRYMIEWNDKGDVVTAKLLKKEKE